MRLWQTLSCAALPCAVLLAPPAAQATPAALFDNIRPPAGVTLSAIDSKTPITVVLTLPMRDRAGAEAYGNAVSDPDNALYGHYIKPAEFGARFGGDAGIYEFLRNWAVGNGLTPGQRSDARLDLSVTGTARQFAGLFRTSFAGFTTKEHGDGRVTLRQPILPDALAGRVIGVVGLSSYAHYAPLYRLKGGPRADVGTGYKNSGYDPSDFRNAYDVPAQTSSTQTESIGVFEEAGSKLAEIQTFEKQYGLPNTPISDVGVDGSSTAPNFEVDVEVALDIETIIGENPAIKQIVVYVDTNSSFSTQLIQAFDQVAQDDIVTELNISYGLDEATQGASAVQAEGAALVQLQTQGQTVFASSGDDGSEGREQNGVLNAPDPGSQPLLTGVGGTTMNTVTAGGNWASETTWNDGSTDATGGGVSAVWAIPSYQVIHGVSIAVKNGGSATMRNVPDVAADADPNTGASVYTSGILGGWEQVGGTSLAAPLWTAWVSIVNANRVAKGLPRVGFLNPLLYKGGVLEGAIGFHDITVGNNGTPGYAAGIGYDNVTGFGSIDVASILPFATK